MINIIKMDLYRLLHSISFKVMFLAIIGLAFFATNMTKMDINMMAEQREVQGEYVDVSTPPEGIGIFVDTKPAWIDGDVPLVDLSITFLASRLVLILCVIFVPLFVNAESKSGYIKNIAGQLSNKGILVISKLIVAAIQVFIILAGFVIFTWIAGVFCWKDRMVLGSLSDFGIAFFLQYLLHFSLSAVALMFTILFKNSGLSMTWGILCSAGTMSLLYGFINSLLHSLEGFDKFDVTKYMIETNISYINNAIQQDACIRMFVVGVVYVLFASVVSILVMQKRDI